MEEEIKEEILDSPLVVHQETDASYQQTAGEVGMYATHTEEETSNTPTLERHRFKKDKKKKNKWYVVFLLILVVGAAVLAGLYYSGTVDFTRSQETTTAPRKSYTTRQENKFDGVITVKSTYIFFEGKEINGISELEKKVKYLDKGTSFVVQDENADSNFLNYEVLSLLTKYEINYDITHVVSSGLVSVYETTASKTTAKKTTASSSAKQKASSKSADKN